MGVIGILFGGFLVLLGLLFIRLGHKPIGKYRLKGGIILKLFSPRFSRFDELFLGWTIGLLFIWLGGSLLLSGGSW
jgi:hypothetical protein